MLGFNEESKSYFKELTDKKNDYSQKSFFYLGKIFQEMIKLIRQKIISMLHTEMIKMIYIQKCIIKLFKIKLYNWRL